ncbi:MAG: anhydro-N-acetylmuramic acid kinase [Bradyrhizobium sp.]|nr:MAG: anhydro-N-acetylmuramic acid kinase [Bradyrhizobium sp.]
MNAKADEIVTAIGAISGTSMDGIDVALIRSDGRQRLEAGPGATYPYPADVAAQLRAVIADPDATRRPLAELEAAVTDAHVAAIENLIAEFAVDRRAVSLVGMHGQTVLHRPREHFTRQLCDGARAAAALSLDVVCDFRSADVAAGGEGAPLVPLYHAAMCAALARPLAVLNWGGVGNVTFLGPGDEILAFDTGPANALLDDFVRRRRGLAHDEDGRLAASGRIDNEVVAALMRDPYFERPAPKSLDRNHFHHVALDAVAALDDADGAATLAAFTVESTAAAARQFSQAPQRWLVCGGGRRNATLMQALAKRLATPVDPIESIGFDGDVVEAQCFGYLALRSRQGLPLSLPTTTGVPRPMAGGRLWPARR